VPYAGIGPGLVSPDTKLARNSRLLSDHHRDFMMT